MKISTTTFNGRKAWQFDNDAMSVVMLQGGGHIASTTLGMHPDVNPMWVPTWKSIEPWQYKRDRDQKRYTLKLLASICGHNLCLGWFGEPSEAEARQGLETHGEASVARWSLIRKNVSSRSLALTTGCELPVAQIQVQRTLKSRIGANVINVEERIHSTSKRDLPFSMCQHVTLGAPFLEKGVTRFDMPAKAGLAIEAGFSTCPRLKPGHTFTWPNAKGVKGEAVDMRQIAKHYRKSSDFSTQQMDPSRDVAWFSAINARQGVMLAYVWDRRDYPWLGNWEENFGRTASPWDGATLTRGMEFTNTPFPGGLRQAIALGQFQGEPTFRWLPARGTLTFKYAIVMLPISSQVKAVLDIRPSASGYEVDLKT